MIVAALIILSGGAAAHVAPDLSSEEAAAAHGGGRAGPARRLVSAPEEVAGGTGAVRVDGAPAGGGETLARSDKRAPPFSHTTPAGAGGGHLKDQFLTSVLGRDVKVVEPARAPRATVTTAGVRGARLNRSLRNKSTGNSIYNDPMPMFRGAALAEDGKLPKGMSFPSNGR
jgi:hypothetical protein